MTKKYLSLEEAAKMLAVSTDELIRLRERGDIRGFADRGTWKFKMDDVEDLVRRRQADSDPEVRLYGDPSGATSPEGEKNFLLEGDDAGSRSLKDSDSDVRLGDAEDSSIVTGESDVKLVGPGSDSDIRLLSEDESEGAAVADEDSDSDVKLVGADSDSDVKLADAEDDSDSDVKLVDGETDADVNMAGASSAAEKTEPTENLLLSEDSDSDVQLIKDDSSSMVAGSSGPGSSVLDDSADDSGISLAGDSSLLLGDESGISLDSGDDIDVEDEGITLAKEDDDSGISLDAGSDISLATGDSGISLETGDSGISLESVGDSGISLEEDSFSGTIPMMDALSDESVPETQFEIPSLEEESAYELNLGDDDAETGVLEVQAEPDSGEATLDDAVFELDEEEAFETADEFESAEELELEEDAFEEEELDVFDAADVDMFAEEGEEFEPRAGVRRMAMAEADWGTGTFAALIVATLMLSLLTVVTMDLVANTATASSPNPVSSALLNALGGLYK